MIPKRDKPKTLDKFVGCLLGLACGDALGAPVEEWTHEAIKGSLGFIRDFQTTILGRGIITDDTQLTILLAESLIEKEKFDPAHFAGLIGDWMRRNDEGIEPARGASQVLSLAARRLYKGTYWKRSGEFSAGNAPAVRVCPLSLFHLKRPVDILLRDASDSSVPTHVDPLAISGAQAFAVAIHLLLHTSHDDFTPEKYLKDLTDVVGSFDAYVRDSILELKSRIIPRDELDEAAFVVPGGPLEITHFDRSLMLEEDIRELASMGTGKFILQSLNAALFSFLIHPFDPENAILCAVNAGGDSDTIGAMTGALSGTLNGAQSIPSRWLNDLEKKDKLIDLANMLYDLAISGKTTKEYRGWRLAP